MSKLSGIRDLDREILGKVEDIDLLNTCSIDKYTWFIVCDDAFIRRRMLKKYPEISQYKWQKETWKQFFSRAVHYILKMKEKYNYYYTFGNFAVQYHLLEERYGNNIHYGNNYLLCKSSQKGELALVIWSLKAGADINYNSDTALSLSIEKGHLDIVKYLVEHGANFQSQNHFSIRIASEKGHLDILKYLVEVGSDIHAYVDIALRVACLNGHLEIVKYLVEEVGANIYILCYNPLEMASKSGHIEIVKYLVEKYLVENRQNIHTHFNLALKTANKKGYIEIADYLRLQIYKNLK
jgi:hypothetical protein